MAPVFDDQQLRLLELLRVRYPTIVAAHTEMISLHAILALPKGTDHYISDIHGAYEQFDHVLRTASGAVRRKIAQTFEDELSSAEQVELAMLVYYPEHQAAPGARTGRGSGLLARHHHRAPGSGRAYVVAQIHSQ